MSVFSAHWYRVENLKPRLRAHVRIHRHHYRGERWHVLQDPSTGRTHRFGPHVYFMLALMDGSRSVSEIWNAALSELGDTAPGQNELITLLSQLHASDLLQCDVTPDSTEVFERFGKTERQKWASRLMNPMFARIPLWDPDAWLERWVPQVERLFTPGVLVAWLAFVAFAGLTAAAHWDELSAPGLGAILEPQNLLILCIAYPLVKLVHELGHAFATRVFGGEVHEVGVMFLILVPMPYVDASASTSFGSKWKRITVASAGVMVELFLSGAALLLWLEIAPGFLRSVLWNVMLIGGFSTLLFNGNPLLRFDGYYVLSDWLEIPNFASRSTQYLKSLFEQHFMGLPERRHMHLAPGESGWLASYGVLSWIYRLTLTLSIALYLASQFFFVGVLLALWGLVLQLGLPAARGIAHLRNDPRVEGAKLRVAGAFGSLAVAGLLGLFVVPFPSWSTHEGVVWIPEHAQLRAGADGFITRLHLEPNAPLAAGQVAVETRDPELEARVRSLEARLDELRAEQARDRQRSIAAARIRSDEIAHAKSELASARAKRARTQIRAQAAGHFVLVERDLADRFVRRGDIVGYVAQLDAPTVRTLVLQQDIAALRGRLASVEVRLAEAPERALPATVDAIVPTASTRLPSSALGAGGGGAIAIDTRDPEGLTAARSFFTVDLSLPPGAPISGYGGRVHVRFDYEAEPLFGRLSRSARRLFMGELGV